ncbi:sigma-70 family RNA polymerase sigma factor [Plantactinospora sp. B5E13]|uniref:sigma-70 family RNA polymerase sigma factor n=1 Tax=unclassified Plantactinospora TaxID=2631981 RepID=UPI00325EC304
MTTATRVRPGAGTGNTGTDADAGADAAGTQTADDLLRTLFAEYGQALLGYVTGLTGDWFRAEDIVQETLLRAWRNADQLRRQPPALRAWLFRVARNLVVDHARARRARPQEVSAGACQVPAVDDHADDVLTAVEVNRALELLTPSHRLILIEVYLRGHSVNEAARSLRIPVGTAKSRLYYAARCFRHSVRLDRPRRPIEDCEAEMT